MVRGAVVIDAVTRGKPLSIFQGIPERGPGDLPLTSFQGIIDEPDGIVGMAG